MKDSDYAARVKAETLTCRHFNGVQHDCFTDNNDRAAAGLSKCGASLTRKRVR